MNKTLKVLFVLLFLLIVGVSSNYAVQNFTAAEDRAAKITEADYFGDSIKEVIYLEQNWSASDSIWFYTTSQGSDLLPYQLFLHLEQADSRELFRADETVLRYRYLPQNSSWGNPDALPLGFVKDSYRGKDYVGFSCAACHTAQINYQGLGIRIDGAPAMADMEQFLLALERALKATLDNGEKLARLAENLYGSSDAAHVAKARAELQFSYEQQQSYNRANQPLHGEQLVHYGYARLDAFGRIYNRILSHLTPNDLSNYNAASAPVSYPFLWDTPQHDYVQWNGVSQNAKTGALGRNVGEVMGVFGTMELHSQTQEEGYRSSVDVRNIIRLERHIEKLQSPQWPEQFPAIDPALAERGREVFLQYRCHDCHQHIDRSDEQRRVQAQMASLPLLGTDPQMATNAISYGGKSGYFEGLPVEHDDPTGAKFAAVSKVLPLLAEAGRGVVTQPDLDKPAVYRGILRLLDVLVSIWDNPAQHNTERQLDFEANSEPAEYLLAYKGRPLNGIWATAPYLHNGSVLNLYELFLPQCTEQELATDKLEGQHCRSMTFTVGSREFDPVKVGFVNRPAADYPGLFEFDTRLPSNSNAGHEYAAGKTPVIKRGAGGSPLKNQDGSAQTELLPPINTADRWALVEYLKTL
ncbi:hypothetical protein SAMN02745866_03492 [Alteromonadaceae bacterium Bs31]|nr:hypothetical protein SAMN02745866_03492 [Alteromonadaceae bacterium Bs31]